MDDAEARAMLREHGEEPPARGKLGADWLTRAESYRQDHPGGDYDEGTGPDDFVAAADPPPEPVADGQVVAPERRPRRPARSRTPLRDRLAGRQAKAKPKVKVKRKGPRLSTADLITDVWAGIGGWVSRIDPPLGTTLIIESPVAGPALDDVVKDTFLDPALQVAVKYQAKGKVVGALILPPMCVAALEHAQTLPEEQRLMREAFIEPILDRSLVMLARVMGEQAEEIQRRITEEAPAREEAEKLKALIYGMRRQPAAPDPEPVPA
jgi:hypothetical protein